MAQPGPSPDVEMRRSLVVVDLQNGDAHPESAYVARKRRQHGDAAAQYYLGRLSGSVLPNTQRLVDAFRAEGSTVIFVRIQSLTDDGRDRSPHHRSRGIHFPPGSDESQLLAALAPGPNDIVLSKTSASAFVATGLADLLANLEITDLFVSGVVTGGCVAATVLDAVRLGRFHVAVVEDATATWTPEMQAEGMAQMRAAGAEVVGATAALQPDRTAAGSPAAIRQTWRCPASSNHPSGTTRVSMKSKRYDGYRSFAYLTAGTDYQEFELVPETERVPSVGLDLTSAERERVERILDNSIVVSLHDHPTLNPSDLSQVREYNRLARQVTGYYGLSISGLDAVFDNFMDGHAYVTSDQGWKWTDIIHDIGMRFSDIAHQRMVVRAERTEDIRRAHRDGLVALIPGLEAATPIENEIDRLDVLYGLGVRQIGIVYSQSNGLGSGHRERDDGGLTLLGRRAVQRMNRLGVAIDISHAGDRTARDTIERSELPVFITHAGSRAVWPTRRMKPDDLVVALAEKGGVIGIEAAPNSTPSLEHPRHSIDSVMDHFTHLVKLVGIEHVAFGPDTMFGDHWGLYKYHSRHLAQEEMTVRPSQQEYVDYVEGLENPSECFTTIVGSLVQRGYADDQIEAVIGGNVMRVLDAVWV